jgi:hypothetical protein
MRRKALLLAFVASALASPYPAKPDKAAKAAKAMSEAATTTAKGAGTGVTEKIAPSGAPPAGCVVDFSSDFALEARFIRTPPAIKNVAEPSDAAPSSESKASASPAAAKTSAVEPAAVPSPKPAAVESAAVPSPKPAVVAASTSASISAPAAAAAAAAAATPAADGDSTLTLRSTRTQTRTVTVRRTVVGQKPAIATSESAPEGKGVRKAYLVAQIGDGQLQVPTKPVTLSVSTASPSSPSSGSKSAPPAGTIAVPTGVVSIGIISQISDGQIQAPKGPATATSVAIKPAVASVGPAAAAQPAAVQAPPVAPAAAPAPAVAPMAGMSGHEGMNMHRRQAPPPAEVGYACRGQRRKAVNGEDQVNAEVVLQGGILKDNHLDPRSNSAANRTGYIASNGQFQ